MARMLITVENRDYTHKASVRNSDSTGNYIGALKESLYLYPMFKKLEIVFIHNMLNSLVEKNQAVAWLRFMLTARLTLCEMGS